MPKQTARAIFQVAFADRIGTRLQTAQKDTTAQAITADEQSGTASTALVLAEKTRQVEKFYQDNNDARGHYKGVSMTGWSESAHQAGRKAADSARLHRSTEIGTPEGGNPMTDDVNIGPRRPKRCSSASSPTARANGAWWSETTTHDPRCHLRRRLDDQPTTEDDDDGR